jgi:hypothetical protein
VKLPSVFIYLLLSPFLISCGGGGSGGDNSNPDGQNDTAELSVSIAAASINENAGAAATTGTVTRNSDASNALLINLASNDTGEATVPATVTITAGQASATFNINAVDDSTVDGNQAVIITASAAGHDDGTDTVTVNDNDTASLSLNIAASNFSEGAGAAATTGTVTRNSDITSPLTVNLRSDDTSEAIVPATVIIAANQFSATFDLAAVEDNLIDGTQTVTITASATGHANGTDTVAVTDNDSAALTLSIVAASISEDDGAAATNATVTRNSDTTNTLTVNLSSNDTSEATVPATVTIAAGQASATFGIDAVDDSAVDGTQRVTITANAIGHSNGTDTINVNDDDTVPRIEPVGSLSFAVDFSGDLVILGEVKNTGATATFIQARCNLFDFDGNLLETETTYISGSVVKLVGTGSNTNTALVRDAVGVYKAWSSTPSTSVDNVSCTFPYDTHATTTPLANLELSRSITRQMDSLGDLRLTGFVKNSGSTGLTFGQTIFAIKNTAGKLLDVESTFIDGDIVTIISSNITTDTALNIGAEGTFDARTDVTFNSTHTLTTYFDWSDTNIQSRVMARNSMERELLSKKERWQERDDIIDELRKQLE